MFINRWKLLLFCIVILIPLNIHAQDNFPELLPHHILISKWDVQGNRYAIGTVEANLIIYNGNGVVYNSVTNAHNDWINGISFSPDGNRIVTSGYDNIVKIWNVNTGQLITEFTDLGNAIETVTWSLDDTTIWVLDGLQESTKIATDTINDIYTIDETVQLGTSFSAVLKPSHVNVAIGNISNDILIIDTIANSTVRQLDATPNTDIFEPPHESTRNITWHPTTNLVANGKINGWIHVWDLDSPSDNIPLLSLQANNGASDDAVIPFNYKVEDISFNSDGSKISSVSSDGTFRTWDSQTGVLLTDTNLGEAVLSAAFNPDGSKLIYNTYSTVETPPIVVNTDDISCDGITCLSAPILSPISDTTDTIPVFTWSVVSDTDFGSVAKNR